MSQISEEYLNKVLSKVASLCGFEKWTYERETFENIAQNYFGVIIPFVLNGEKHGANESLRIVFKLAPNDERYRDGRPISACIIDYQTTRISSPAYDVLYLIITSTSSQLRKQYYHQLLDIYFTTFKNILSEAQMPLELYSRSMFDEDLKTVAPACTIIANTAIWLSSGLQQEGHVRSKIVLETDKQWTEAVQTYKNRISSIVDDLTSYGYFTHMK
ncbi:unnamed protein product [Leptosia nina]|uniref:CHK kinase-like domain-containing protein n=1 Tax=Leptosia nina TaxID=320188 RepID=A0AAV1J845_9NEOP